MVKDPASKSSGFLSGTLGALLPGSRHRSRKSQKTGGSEGSYYLILPLRFLSCLERSGASCPRSSCNEISKLYQLPGMDSPCIIACQIHFVSSGNNLYTANNHSCMPSRAGSCRNGKSSKHIKHIRRTHGSLSILTHPLSVPSAPTLPPENFLACLLDLPQFKIVRAIQRYPK